MDSQQNLFFPKLHHQNIRTFEKSALRVPPVLLSHMNGLVITSDLVHHYRIFYLSWKIIRKKLLKKFNIEDF